MDRAQLGMMLEADLLAEGAEIVTGLPWLERVSADIGCAVAACPHLLGDTWTVPLFYYPDGLPDCPDGPAVTCARCGRKPRPACHVCGRPADDGVAVLSGLLLITVALCPEHSSTETEL